MRTATAIPDDDRPAVMFARLPERLNDEQRRMKYDDPLAAAIRESGLDASVRGFSQPGEDGQIEWVGIEVTLDVLRNGAFIAERLVELGAPLATVIEVETEKASVELSLGEAAGR